MSNMLTRFLTKPSQDGGSAASPVFRRVQAEVRDEMRGDEPRPLVVEARAPSTKTLDGLRFSETSIETTTDIANILFHSVVNERIQLGQHLFARIAVAQLSAGTKKVILLVDRRKLSPDDITAVNDLLTSHGYSLADEGPQAYNVAPAIVIALSQGHLDQERLGVERSIINDKTKSSLLNSFIEIVSWAFINNANDIDFAIERISDYSQICFKIGGQYVKPARFRIPTDTAMQMIGIAWQKSAGGASAQFEMKSEQQAQIELDVPRSSGAPNGARVRLRWSSMPYDKGTVVTLRLHRLGDSSHIRSLESAGYLPTMIDTFRRVGKSEGGMVVLSGVVGSGKSTTLAQLINMLPAHIKKLTFEDPVELELQDAYQKTISRDLFASGADPAFLAATRALYRSALDVLLLGEIRDPETGLVARQVIESGHSVYTTVHAKSALGIVDRFASPAIGIPRDVLATPDALKLLVYQALLPTNCPHCTLSPEEFAREFLDTQQRITQRAYFSLITRLYGLEPEQFRLRNHVGCPHCQRPELAELNGFQGRTVVAEMIEPDEALLIHMLTGNNIELVREWRSRATTDFTDPNMDGRTAMECALYKAGQGLIDPREIEPRFTSFETVERKKISAPTLRTVESHPLRAVSVAAG